MKTCLILLRRDLRLLKMNMLKRVGVLFAVSLAVSLLSTIQGQRWILMDSLTGIEAAVFRENPLAFPAGWALIAISGVLVAFDFVRADFYEYSSNILVRVRKRYYWLSKMMAGAVLSLFLVLLYALVYGVANLLYTTLNGESLLTFAQWRGISPYIFIGIYFGYCIFQLMALLFKEVVGVLVVLACFTLGMASDSFWFPVNHLMAIRSLEMNPLGVAGLGQNLLFIGVIIAAAILAGGMLIERIDIFSRKEND